jgi:DNA/RNA endonuclease YhcR with UshA esterase domain
MSMADDAERRKETQSETPVDRFESEMEDLEHGRTMRQVFLYSGVGLLFALAIVGAFLLGGVLLKTKPESSHQAITNIDTYEPRRTSLAEKPKVFRWESISGAASYVVRIQEEGGTTDLVARESKTNWIELLPEEQARLITGGRYSWSVRARSPDGWPIGEGQSSFSL